MLGSTARNAIPAFLQQIRVNECPIRQRLQRDYRASLQTFIEAVEELERIRAATGADAEAVVLDQVDVKLLKCQQARAACKDTPTTTVADSDSPP